MCGRGGGGGGGKVNIFGGYKVFCEDIFRGHFKDQK